MLLEFMMRNYKSFAEETRFSMLAAPKQSGLDYSLLEEKINGKTIRGLCSSVVYGPNAAGKTNIIGAMDVFRSIVLRGGIKNPEDKSSPNPASVALELIPNSMLREPQPVEFSIDFIEKKLRINYKISIDLGLFLDEGYKRSIISEDLNVNGENIFSRGKGLSLGSMNAIKEYLSDSKKRKTKRKTEQTIVDVGEIAEKSLDREELFLTNGFKILFSYSFVQIVTDWFRNRLMVYCRGDSMKSKMLLTGTHDKTVYVDKLVDKAAKIFGVNSNAIAYVASEEDAEAKPRSIITNIRENKSIALPVELFESYGTLRLINLFPLVVRALQTGGTLVVDEFDASIHPMALMNIVNIFHNNDVNVRHAQLIFNTHNPVFLNSNLFRRDEIKFVERDDVSHNSALYSLADFGTAGEKGVRKHEDYMKNYFVGRYGAIKDIDFTPLFEEILSAERGCGYDVQKRNDKV